MRITVTGAGGFIGHHLCNFLKNQGHYVVGVDIKLPEYSATQADEFHVADLRQPDKAKMFVDGDAVYALAADMGGMGYLATHGAKMLHDNLLININTLDAAVGNKVKKYLFTSSACVYPEYRQVDLGSPGLKESDAYPAQPQDAYGWEKLTTEWLCKEYSLAYPIDTRMVRFHNIFGPMGSWVGGREKAPAAICRKVAVAKKTGDLRVEIWGDGLQERSFCYIDDCVDGLVSLMNSDWTAPINLGQDRQVSINWLVDTVADIAGIKVEKVYVSGPQGVRSRNSDNSIIREKLGWEPKVSLEEGLAKTYAWIEEQVNKKPELF